VLPAPALLPSFCGGSGVGSGAWVRLDRESADALSGCPSNDSSAAAQVLVAPTGTAGLIRPSFARGRGSQGPTASGCVPPLSTREKLKRRKVGSSTLPLTTSRSFSRQPSCLRKRRKMVFFDT